MVIATTELPYAELGEVYIGLTLVCYGSVRRGALKGVEEYEDFGVLYTHGIHSDQYIYSLSEAGH